MTHEAIRAGAAQFIPLDYRQCWGSASALTASVPAVPARSRQSRPGGTAGVEKGSEKTIGQAEESRQMGEGEEKTLPVKTESFS